jgi:hypothetical protein
LYDEQAAQQEKKMDNEEASLADSSLAPSVNPQDSHLSDELAMAERKGVMMPSVGPYNSLQDSVAEPTLPLSLLVGTRLLSGHQGVEGANMASSGRTLNASWYPCHDKVMYRLGAPNLNNVADEARFIATQGPAGPKPTHVQAEYLSRPRNGPEQHASELRTSITQGQFQGTLRGLDPVNFRTRLPAKSTVPLKTVKSIALHAVKSDTAESMVMAKVRELARKQTVKNKSYGKKMRGYALEENMPVHRQQRSMIMEAIPVEVPPHVIAKGAPMVTKLPVKQALFAFPPGQEPLGKETQDMLAVEDTSTIASAASAATLSTTFA